MRHQPAVSKFEVEAAKRLGQVEDQRAETEALMATEERAPVISPELVTALVDVFGHFRDLTREEKRQLLRWVSRRRCIEPSNDEPYPDEGFEEHVWDQ